MSAVDTYTVAHWGHEARRKRDKLYPRDYPWTFRLLTYGYDAMNGGQARQGAWHLPWQIRH